ncbi:ATP-binding protein [Methanolobus sp. WCC4]|uniref:ATP-binding protein n=1 Tax=Methanolobus sp. WCC4 TaxID=3125784 RepID=UPI0030F5A7DD
MKNRIEDKLKLRKLGTSSEELFQTPVSNIDYQKITDDLVNIAGAKYGVFIKFEERTNSYFTLALSANSSNIEKACKLLGFQLKGKEWQIEPVLEERIKNRNIIRFSAIHELTKDIYPEGPILLIEKTFNIGEAIIANIFRENYTIGYFILIMEAGRTFDNEELIEIYTRQIGHLLERKRTEEELQFQLDFQRTVSEISTSFLSGTDEDLDNTIEFTLKKCGSLFDVDRAYISFLSSDKKEMKTRYIWSAHGINDLVGKEHITPLERYPWFKKNVTEMDVVHIPDTEDLSPEADIEKAELLKYSIRSFLGIPMKMHGKMFGYMGFNSIKRKHEWTQEQISLLTVISDIMTSAFERKFEKEELLKREKQLSEAQRIGNTGSWEFDLNTGKVHASEEAHKIYGTLSRDVSIKEVQSFALPEYRHMLDRKLSELVTSKIPYYVEFSIKRPIDGAIRHIHSIAEYLDDRNIVVGTLQDITERKEAEMKLQSRTEMLDMALEATRAGIWDLDLTTGNITLQGLDSWHSITGYSPEDLPVFNLDMWIKMIHPDDIQITSERLQDVILGKKEHYMSEYRMLHKEGHWIWVRAQGKIAQYDQEGKPVRMYGTHINIDENKKAEERARNASNAKSEFLANMSHEMRTPLNGMIGFTDLLLRSELNEQQQHYMRTVSSSANSLLDLINDVLDLSKIEAGKLELDNGVFDIIELCDLIADILKYRAHEKGLELLVNISPDLPRMVTADRLRLRQILVNLLANAIKFTNEGEVELKVEASQIPHDREKKDIKFSVRDTGIGIAEENRQRIFGSFSQADGSITRKYGGTGLGLSISSKLLEKMGSKLELESEEGKGSTFYFTITIPVEQESIASGCPDTMIRKALIADDNPENCSILQNILRSKGITADIVPDRFTALDLLQQNTDNDLIIVDKDIIPDIEDADLYNSLKEKCMLQEEIPFIVLHNSTDLSFEQNKDNIHPLVSLIKPVRITELFEAMSVLSPVKEPEIQGIKEKEEEGTLPCSHAYRILIADDNKTNAALASAIISNILPDADILTAKDGNEAVQLYMEYGPDLVLMDVQMPEASGYDATAMIRDLEKEKKEHVPVIALTAASLNEEKERCLASGMDDYLIKPIVSDTIKRILEKWLLEQEDSVTTEIPGSSGDAVHFNEHWLLKNTSGNKEMCDKLVALALKAFDDNYCELTDHLDRGDMTGIKSIAHSTRGTALNIGFNLMALVAEELEMAADKDKDIVPELLMKMEEELDLIKNLF